MPVADNWGSLDSHLLLLACSAECWPIPGAIKPVHWQLCKHQARKHCHFNASTPTVTQRFGKIVPLYASGGLRSADTLRAHVCSVLVPCGP